MANANGWGDGASNNNIGWGKGADNAIGWGDIHADSYAGLTDIVGVAAVDPDAQAFITAAAITDPTQQSAINTLVVDLKGYSIWTKMEAIYPMVGSTSSQHKYNLKDPRDLDAAFRMTFHGGVTHSSNGITFATNGYADTKWLPSANSTTSNVSEGAYSRTNLTADYALFGSLDLSFSGVSVSPKASAGNTFFSANNNLSDGNANFVTDTRGLFHVNKDSLTVTRLFKNGSSIRTATVGSTTPPAFALYLGARNYAGTTQSYFNGNLAFGFLGDTLTLTEGANFYTAVQAFQTTLGRSIGTQTVSDADAQAFVTAADIQDQVEATAVNNLVIGMKADGLWTKMMAIYPFVGSSSSSTSYNLKNTAQYQITWNGGVTHASTGVTFNGSNGYGNTNFAPNSVLTANSNHVALYSRTAAARTNGLAIDFGQGADVNIQSGIFGCSRRSSNVAFYGATNATTNGSFTAANTNGSGLFTNSITAATSRKIYRNGSVLGSLTTNISQTLSAAKMYIAAFNNNDAGVLLYSNYEASFFSIGDGLDDTEATNLNTRVTTFQTSLNRNI